MACDLKNDGKSREKDIEDQHTSRYVDMVQTNKDDSSSKLQEAYSADIEGLNVPKAGLNVGERAVFKRKCQINCYSKYK